MTGNEFLKLSIEEIKDWVEKHIESPNLELSRTNTKVPKKIARNKISKWTELRHIRYQGQEIFSIERGSILVRVMISLETGEIWKISKIKRLKGNKGQIINIILGSYERS